MSVTVTVQMTKIEDKIKKRYEAKSANLTNTLYRMSER